ncbi:MAG: PhzF family phenazine biosynthesis protein [Gammaproteobacteria bacterium]|nr:PhzF family phenazine biosynthesis protein [Gammaproteobacteria bacterium]
MSRNYKVVDVFTAQPLLGNPVAVVLDAEGLDSATLQQIARWTNLSETTFVLPPTRAGADYRLRIFTPGNELPFAGHPTLGSAHAVLESGRVAPREGRLVQECDAGLISIAVSGSTRVLTLPTAQVTALAPDDVAELEAILGTPVIRTAAPALVDVGPVWIVAQLASADAVLRMQPDLARSAAFERRLRATGITVFGAHAAGEADIEVRSFAPSCGVGEDPVCGSGNGAVAVFQRERGLLHAMHTSYVATQGRCVGRRGRVSVSVSTDGTVTVGGECVTVLDGILRV